MKITIITATYNSVQTLSDTFDSVLSQNYKDIDYIVKDGGSTDGTIELIQSYIPKFEGRMRLLKGQDLGVYDAMNKALELAEGEIVGFLNSDDFFTSGNILDEIVAAFKGNDIEALYGDVHYVNFSNLGKCVRYYSSACFRPWLMRFGLMPAHPSFYCKKSVYDRLGDFDLSYVIAADFDILLRFIYVSKIKTKYLSLDFVTMRVGGLSTSGWKSHKQIIKDHLRALKKAGIYSNIFFMLLRFSYKLLDKYLFFHRGNSKE